MLCPGGVTDASYMQQPKNGIRLIVFQSSTSGRDGNFSNTCQVTETSVGVGLIFLGLRMVQRVMLQGHRVSSVLWSCTLE